VLLIALACVAVTWISGCTTMRALERDPGTDLSPVKAGSTRQQVQAVLGDPLREWVTRADVQYCLYRYDAGIEPSPMAATQTVLINIATLGLFEAIEGMKELPNDFRGPRKYQLVAVSYDSKDVALGVFYDVDEFTVFPEDGRAPASPPANADSTAH
jgi:hypothetical protein